MSLAPTLGGNIGFEQPVDTPSALEGVASLAGGFAQAYQPPRPTSASNQLASDKASFYNSLQAGRAAIEQGRTREGNRAIQRAYRTFSGKYGREHEDVNSAFQDATGVSFDVEVTGSVVDIEQIAQTPEFNITAATVQSQFPDATPDQVFQVALQKETDRLATDMKINEIEQRQKVNWYDVEQTYVDKARQTGDVIRGMLSSAQSDQVVTPDEARGIRNFYSEMFGSVTKPVGVDQTSWDRYQEEYMEPLTAIVDGAIGLGEQVGISEDMNRSLQQITAKAVAQGKLPASILVKMQQDSEGSYESFIRILEQASKNPKYLDNTNFVLEATYEELLDWVTTFEEQTDIDFLKVDISDFDGLSNEEKRESILNGSGNLSISSGAEQIALDIVQTHAKFEGIPNRALRQEDFSRVFNPSYFNGIAKIFQKNPVVGRQIANDAVRVINSQKVATARALQSEATQLGMQIIDGKVIPNPENIPSSVQAAVDTFFGGDWGQAFESGGVDSNGRTHTMIKVMVDTAQRDLLPKVRKFSAATQKVDQLTETFLSEEITGIQGGEGEEGVGGSAGEDTLSGTPEGLVGLTQLIDRTEGGADYDTLFGFSQKPGGQFAGVRPSQMTIGELKEFTSPSGEYGQWVKGKVGRVATPLGRYQFVGTTLRETAEKMGLGDDILFDQRTQDAMFAFKVRERIQDKGTIEAKRKALRAEWEGFKNVSDQELDKAIEAFESGKEIDFGGITLSTGRNAPEFSDRPQFRPEDLRKEAPEELPEVETIDATSVVSQEAGEASISDAEDASGREVPEEPSTPTRGPQNELLKESTEETIRRILEVNGADPDSVPTFETEEEAIKALSNGTIRVGTLIRVGDEILRVE